MTPFHGPILTTKLTLNRLRDDIISRPRLTARLYAANRYRLTLLSAPAGTGKSTLLAEWVSQFDDPNTHIATVNLDAKDNQPHRFFAYLVAAIRSTLPDINLQIDQIFHEEVVLDSILSALINELSHYPEPLQVVLDNYHLITHSDIHRLMTFLLDYLPDHVHLVIATQSDPPFPLARLRARGELQELRLLELAFNEYEANEFYKTNTPSLSDSERQMLLTKIEGWAIGLRLTALELNSLVPASQFIAEFAGINRYISDYFDAEIFANLSEPMQIFVTQTSILERLSAPLCEAVTGQKQSQNFLRTLERNNTFLLPLDSNRRWYRYHHLFADYLRQRFNAWPLKRQHALHQQAATWLESHGDTLAAIPHWLESGNYTAAGTAIETTAQTLLDQDDVQRILYWLKQFPENEIQQHKSLQLLSASVSALLENISPEETRIQDTARALSNSSIDTPSTLLVQGALALNTAETFRLSRQTEQAITAFDQAFKLNVKAGNISSALLAGYQLANLLFLSANLREAQNWFRRLIQLANDHQSDAVASSPVLPLIHVGLSNIFLEWNELDSAMIHAEQALTGAEGIHAPQLLVISSVTLAGVQQATGQPEAAIKTLQQVADVVINSGLDQLTSYVAANHARLLLLQNQIDQVQPFLRNTSANLINPAVVDDPAHAAEILVWFRYYLLCGRATELINLIPRFVSKMEDIGQISNIVEARALLALVFARQQDHGQAVTALEQALSISTENRYTRVYLDIGVGLIPLLRQVSMGNQHPEEGMRLLRLFGDKVMTDEQNIYSIPRQLQPLSVPLSERELEILRLIADGLSNYEIANRLIVTLETVKWHIKNIYRKLDVSSRTQAITRARELRL
jgi:LuxR family maltose regulon positive regulatory protein